MKGFLFNSLRTKIMFAVVSVVALSFTVTFYTVSHNAGNMQTELALQYTEVLAQNTEVLAQKNASNVKATLEVALDSARTLANSLEGLKRRGFASRAEADAMLREVLERNPQFLGVWSVWEPNAFDGKDKQYANTPSSDRTGRYIPYWNRGHGYIAYEPLHDYDTPGPGDYYVISKRTSQETIIEPYSYNISGKVILMTSLVVPIKENGWFVGVAGVDMSLSELQEMVSKINPYDVGYARLISNGGLYVAGVNSQDAGKDIGTTAARLREKQFIRAGKIYRDFEYSQRLKTNVYSVYVPIDTGHTSTPWSVAVTVPMDRVLAGVIMLRNINLVTGVVSIVLLLLIITAVLNELVNRPLGIAMGVAKQLSEGNLNTRIDVKARDEMGKLLSAMRDMAQKLAQMKRIETELTVTRTQIAIARQIQQSLFPAQPPFAKGISLAGQCLPAAQVGGDYFDYFPLANDWVGIFISDVSGHGVGPALLMAEARTILHSSIHAAHGASEMLRKLNSELYYDLDHAEQFITMFYATVNVKTHQMTYADAGHPSPVIIRALKQQCMTLTAEGMILGVLKEVIFEEKQIQLEKGDLICFYTDGVTEAQNPSTEEYGINRLCDFLSRNYNAAPHLIIESALDEFRKFCQCSSFADDVTIVIMKVE